MKNKKITLDKDKLENVVAILGGLIALLILFSFFIEPFQKNIEAVRGSLPFAIITIIGYLGLFFIFLWLIDFIIEKYLKIKLFEK